MLSIATQNHTWGVIKPKTNFCFCQLTKRSNILNNICLSSHNLLIVQQISHTQQLLLKIMVTFKSGILSCLFVSAVLSQHQASERLCYGPEIRQLHGVPAEVIEHWNEDLCIWTFLNYTQSGDNASYPTTLELYLSYGPNIVGRELLDFDSPDSGITNICQLFGNCDMCLGYTNIFLDWDWAFLSPKFIIQCKDVTQNTVVYTDAISLGAGMLFQMFQIFLCVSRNKSGVTQHNTLSMYIS